VADVEGIVRMAQARGVLVAVDNTFTTPRAFRPFDHGADIVIHSVTKLLAGHSDATLGYIATKDPALRERIRTTAVTMGFTPSPFDCWLAERGLYTFDLRYDRAEANARELAEALAGMPGVRRVLYPTRPDHPDHNRAVALLGGRGSHMVSFEIEGGREAANRLVRAAPMIAFAPTLGDVGTTLSHAATSSHRALTPEGRAAIGIGEGFFRISVGCEDIGRLTSRVRRRHRRRPRTMTSDQRHHVEVERRDQRPHLARDHGRVRQLRAEGAVTPGKAQPAQQLGKVHAIEISCQDRRNHEPRRHALHEVLAYVVEVDIDDMMIARYAMTVDVPRLGVSHGKHCRFRDGNPGLSVKSSLARDGSGIVHAIPQSCEASDRKERQLPRNSVFIDSDPVRDCNSTQRRIRQAVLSLHPSRNPA
jgi:hypothetical protein